MINTNNYAPVFEPVNQTVVIKESCAVGTIVHYIQAYDPDGDNINFQLDPCKLSVIK